MTNLNELDTLVRQVAGCRETLSKLKEEKDALMKDWESQHTDLLLNLEAAKDNLLMYETWLRDATVEAYRVTGNKKPAYGVAVREVTRLNYPPEDALAWAMKHQMALTLNKSEFEKIAKINTMDFVSVTIELQATIASDLSEVIK